MPRPLVLDVPVSAPTGSAWAIALSVILGLVGVYLLLPRPQRYPPLWGVAATALALLLAGVFLIRSSGAAVEMVLFYLFSAIAIIAGGLLVTHRNPVKAALSFALVVLSTCGLFLLQAAPFLMAATIIIYAGAIIVTFLFVIMLARQSGISDADARSREPLLASIAGFVLLGAILFVLQATYNTNDLDDLLAVTDRALHVSSPEAMQRALGNKREFFGRFRLEAGRRTAAAEPARSLRAALTDLDAEWKEQNANGDRMRQALVRLREAGLEARQRQGSLPLPVGLPLSTYSQNIVPGPNPDQPRGASLPSENVAFLGRSLFTDYLLAVELGGTLLLVATIGAIAISARRAEGLR
ncbi:MAG TPA: NADH-quinone oxidoreductase subunit J [Gemmataceae bacterium]|nr:NADH-quinone oxidoreductase subunit J [Gemmataceae bacterium]